MEPTSDSLTEFTTTQRLAALLSYEGTHYHGSQFQSQTHNPQTLQSHPNGTLILPTIQHALEEALQQLGFNIAKRSGNNPATRVKLAARTDQGVHAEGQVAHFDLPSERIQRIKDWPRVLNRYLPDDIGVQSVQPVSKTFHARDSVCWRWYRYSFYCHHTRPILNRNQALWVHHPLTQLNIEAMQQAARQLLGRHCFTALKHPRSEVLDDWCCVAYSNVLLSESDNMLHFDIVADRFLYKMVRNIAGLLLAIGSAPTQPKVLHPLTPDQMTTLIQHRNYVFSQTAPKHWGTTAKPHGLVLKAIQYPAEYRLFPDQTNLILLNRLVQSSSCFQSEQATEFSLNENLLCQS